MSGTTKNPASVPTLHTYGGPDGGITRLNELLSGPVLTITGSRASTAYGNVVAGEFGAEAAKAGITLLTSGSYGIDAAAIRSALAHDGRVIVLLPSGVQQCHPSGHRDLFANVLAKGGLLISTFDDDAVPSRTACVERNQLMAELTGAVIVVEASLRSSALALADDAHGRGTPVFAVPGPVTSLHSVGPHALLRAGTAKLVSSFEDLENTAAMTGRTLSVALND